MFTVKLATGETFSATAANLSRISFDNNKPVLYLNLEAAPADHDLEWYLQRLDAPGALETVQVYPETGDGFTAAGFTEADNVSLRLLATGGTALTVALKKPDKEE